MNRKEAIGALVLAANERRQEERMNAMNERRSEAMYEHDCSVADDAWHEALEAVAEVLRPEKQFVATKGDLEDATVIVLGVKPTFEEALQLLFDDGCDEAPQRPKTGEYARMKLWQWYDDRELLVWSIQEVR